MRRLFSVLALALAAALALTGCGSADNNAASSSAAKAVFNDADVTFAQSMIPHHQQAVVMAKMAKTQADSAQVKDLATKIEAAQGPEIDTMSGWLKSWGKEQPSGNGMGDMAGMDHGSDGMPGMMSDDDMKALSSTSGSGFDRMFLTMMITHHEGAIEMAKTEQTDGKNADAVALAKKIEADQTAEIAHMKSLLGS